MPRKQALAIENKFIKGLITETTALNFPTDACTETYNCVFDEIGRITRRLGADLEEGYGLNTMTAETNEAFTEFIWNAISTYENGAFLVQQQGSKLHFFDITDNVTPSANKNATTLDLDNYALDGITELPGQFRCQYAQANGNLLLVNRYINPVYIQYDLDTNAFTVTPIILKARDFVGVEDGFGLNTRPTSTQSALKTSSPEHYYNLVNQGWYNDALVEWDTTATTMPSNADAVGYFRYQVDDLFNAGTINFNFPGNSPAPKGHFILNVGEEDRNRALLEDSVTGVTLPQSGGITVISSATGTNIGDYTNLTNVFDNNSTTDGTKAAAFAYAGKNYGVATTVTGALITPGVESNGAPYFSNVAGDTVTVDLYGKNGAPASSTDGTLLGTASQIDSASVGLSVTGTGPIFVYNDTPATQYTHYWVRLSLATGTSITTAEQLFYSSTDTVSERPSCLAFFAGRAWYAGINDGDLGSRLYFSQVVEDEGKYGLCYQVNDPTSDKFADLLATDGGVINIPDMNEVQLLFNFQSQLLVVASNGVWIVSGGQGVFAATDYRVRKISSIGSNSPMSLVDVKGLPIWWAEDGIYTVTYDANYDSTVVRAVTEEKIKEFIVDIPRLNRKYVKGVYDRIEDTVYWLYSTDPAMVQANYYRYDAVLCLNMKSGAFFPWTVTRSTVTNQFLRGAVFIQDGERSLDSKVVYTTTANIAGTPRLSYSTFSSDTYLDWSDFSDLTTFPLDEQDYSSYFITGYRVDGSAITHIQGNYIYSYMDTLTNSSIFVQGLYEFGNSGSSGRWSTPQQAYNSLTTKGRDHMDIKISRRMIRGEGKALQVKYYSETGKPFSIIGWGLYVSGNESI